MRPVLFSCLAVLMVLHPSSRQINRVNGYLAKGVAMGVAQIDSPAPTPLIKIMGKLNYNHQRVRRSKPTGDTPAWCCGSVVPLQNKTAKKTGIFSRVTAGNSIQIIDAADINSDIIPPVDVTDLEVTSVTSLDEGGYVITLAWSTPGDDLDYDTVTDYVFRISDRKEDLSQEKFDDAPDSTFLRFSYDALDTVLLPFGTKVSLNVTYEKSLRCSTLHFIALKAIDDGGNSSPVSNIAEFTVRSKLSLPRLLKNLIANITKLKSEFKRPKTTKKNIKKKMNKRRRG